MNARRKHALIAGIALLLMAAAAGYAYGVAYAGLVNPANAAETLQNLQTQRAQYAGGIAGWVLIALLDLLVAWSLYHYFREGQRRLSWGTAAARVVYTAVLGLAIGQLVLVLPQLSGTPDADVILSHLQRFDRIWSRGLSLFGVHLLGLGLLGWKAPRFPKVLAVLLLIAGLSYTGIHAAKWAAPEAAAAIQQV